MRQWQRHFLLAPMYLVLATAVALVVASPFVMGWQAYYWYLHPDLRPTWEQVVMALLFGWGVVGMFVVDRYTRRQAAREKRKERR